MARTPKTLTPGELRTAKAALKKIISEQLAIKRGAEKIVTAAAAEMGKAHKAADKTHKDAVKAAEKTFEALNKVNQKSIATAIKIGQKAEDDLVKLELASAPVVTPASPAVQEVAAKRAKKEAVAA